MTVLVTGGAGFVGSAYVRRVAATTDQPITVLDALTYAGSLARLGDLVETGRVRFVHGDITDEGCVVDALAGATSVVHFAAESHVDRSLLDPDVFHRTNCEGTDVVCRAAGRHGVERFVHISTDEVYGPVIGEPFEESAPLHPTSPYARSKAESDLIALRHHTEHGLPVLITRSSNQFGPWQFPEKLIPFFVATLVGGGQVPLYGDGLHVRDWLHVDDNCALVDRVASHGEVGTIYNIAAGNERTNETVTIAILEHLGLGTDRIDHVADRIDHDRRYAVRTDRIEALGAVALRPFEPALAETIDWYLANQAWWEPLMSRVRNR